MSHSTEMQAPDNSLSHPAPEGDEADPLVREEDRVPLPPPFLTKRAWAVWALSLIAVTLLLLWLMLDGLYNNPPLHLMATATPAQTDRASPPERLESDEPTALTAATQQIGEMLQSWRMAWERRDAQAYLRHYSQNFVPPNAQTGDQWRQARQLNLSSRSSIKVDIRHVNIESLGQDRFKVTFLQDYTAEKYRERNQRKTLLIERAGEQWQIAGEWNGEHPLEPQGR